MTRRLFAALILAAALPLAAAPAPALADSMTGMAAASSDLPASVRHPASPAAFHILNPDDFVPERIIARPPARGSQQEAQELATLHAEIAAATPERLARAKRDGETENPTLYNAVLGRDLTTLPATWDLLMTVQDEANAEAVRAKAAFQRLRPYAVDPTMPTCNPVNPHKAANSYPSGHATVGYGTGWVLARLMPDMAPTILARGVDYAKSRELCGVHFPSDTEASHVFATLIADRLLGDPRLAGKVAAARAELAGH